MKWNVLPSPASDSTQIRPPINSTICFEIESPSPVPPYSLVVEDSACVNFWKIASCLSRGIPIPVSATEKCRIPGLSPGTTRIATTPVSVNLMAFDTRFTSTRCNRLESPFTYRGTPAVYFDNRSSPFCDAETESSSTTRSTSAAQSNGTHSSSIRPASIFA